MKVRVYKSFDAIPAEVATSLSYPAQPEFFHSLDWFTCLFSASLRGEYRPRVYVLFDATDKPAAALYCMSKRRTRELRSMSNFYTVEYAPAIAVDAGPAKACVEKLIDYIAHEPQHWTLTDFRFLKHDCESYPPLVQALHDRAFFAQRFSQYENWFLPLQGRDFDVYYASRPSRLRHTISRRGKALQKNFKADIQLFTEEGPELNAAVEAYTQVNDSSWKRPEPYVDFMPALAKCCARLGILRLGVLRLDGEPAAAQFWINTPRRAMIYKLSYSEKFKEWSVGSVLSKDMFKQAIDVDRVDEIDYGVGSEPYKKDWMEAVRSIGGIRALNLQTFRGSVHASVEVFKNLAKAVIAIPRAWAAE